MEIKICTKYYAEHEPTNYSQLVVAHVLRLHTQIMSSIKFYSFSSCMQVYLWVLHFTVCRYLLTSGTYKTVDNKILLRSFVPIHCYNENMDRLQLSNCLCHYSQA